MGILLRRSPVAGPSLEDCSHGQLDAPPLAVRSSGVTPHTPKTLATGVVRPAEPEGTRHRSTPNALLRSSKNHNFLGRSVALSPTSWA